MQCQALWLRKSSTIEWVLLALGDMADEKQCHNSCPIFFSPMYPSVPAIVPNRCGSNSPYIFLLSFLIPEDQRYHIKVMSLHCCNIQMPATLINTHSLLRSVLFPGDYIHQNSYTGLFSYVKPMLKTLRENILQCPF